MNLDKPLVSIIMNCFNGEKYLSEALQSVLEQTYENWELIFWDNHSTDDSSAIVASCNDIRIKYYYAQNFTNLFDARHLAYQKCQGKYIAFLDIDDLWFNTKLEKQVLVMEEYTDIVMSHTNTIFFNPEKNISYIANKNTLPSGYVFKNTILKYRISLETVMIRKEILDTNKIYFSKLFNLIGDRDLFTMVTFYGKTVYISEVLGKWRIHSNNFSKKLTIQHPKELKHMYLRFKRRFKEDFTVDLRKNIYEEIILREAINLLDESGYKARKKLNKTNIFTVKSLFIRTMSFLPSNLALVIIKAVRN